MYNSQSNASLAQYGGIGKYAAQFKDARAYEAQNMPAVIQQQLPTDSYTTSRALVPVKPAEVVNLGENNPIAYSNPGQDYTGQQGIVERFMPSMSEFMSGAGLPARGSMSAIHMREEFELHVRVKREFSSVQRQTMH